MSERMRRGGGGGGPESIRSVLARVDLRAREDLGAFWREAAGEAASRYSRAVRLEGGVLTVEVTSAPLLQELLGFRRAEVEEACRGTFGERFRKIRFRAAST